MLQSLHIRHFAIIDALELELEEGFSVLSGETGAGKSILLDALGLILGDRAESTMIRTGQDKADITAEFDCPAASSARQWLQANDLEAMDDDKDTCLIRRVITRNGRSRAYINGQQSPLQQLKELGEHLIDIHGQHSHHSLLKNSQQLGLLDEFARPDKNLQATQDNFLNWQQAASDYAQLKQAAEQRQTRLDFLAFQLKELETLELGSDEFTSLQQESAELSLGSKHLEALQNINELLNDENGASELLGKANAVLQELASKNDLFKELADTLDSADIQAREAADEITRQLEKVDADPARQDWLNNRLGAIQGIARKHRVEANALFNFHQGIRSEHDDLLHADDRLLKLEQELTAMQLAYRDSAQALSKERNKAGKKLEKLITKSIRHLGMPDAEFSIHIKFDKNATPRLLGLDQVEFLFSANPGQNLEALKKIASGGELSRIGLAMAVSSQSKKAAPVVIFDEVDAGIGGVTANTVGEYLQTLSKDYQVLCVTHLAQVAAKADHQYRVMKMSDGKTTHTQVRSLNKNERVTEIVRMLGSQDSDKELMQHAKKLLKK